LRELCEIEVIAKELHRKLDRQLVVLGFRLSNLKEIREMLVERINKEKKKGRVKALEEERRRIEGTIEKLSALVDHIPKVQVELLELEKLITLYLVEVGKEKLRLALR